MSIKSHEAAATSHTSSRGRCLWLRFQAKVLLVLGLRAKAHGVFQEILRINPGDVLALNSLGFNELKDHRLVQALDFLNVHWYKHLTELKRTLM